MNNKSGKKSGLIILLLILLIIAMLAIGVYAYFVTDLLKTPEQLFKKYFLSNVVQLTQMNFEPFNEINKRSETEVTEYNLNVTVNAKEMLLDEENYDVNLTLTTDFQNKNEDLELLVNKGEDEFLKGTIALTNETLGISVPDLYDKYLAIENRDFKKMAENFELSEDIVEVIPDKFPTALSPEEEAKISELTNKYLTKFMEQFDESSYMAEKNININVNSQDITANKYTLSISSRKMYTVITEIISEVLNDTEVLALCDGRISTEQIEQIKNSYEEMLKETPAEDIEETIIKFAVYAADGKTVKTELKVDDNEAYFAITDNSIIFSSIEPKSDSNDIGTVSLVTIKNVFENNSGELTYEIENTYNKDDIQTLQAEYDAKYSDSEYGSSFSRDYSEIYKDSKMKYTISTRKSNEDTITGNITFDMGEELNSFSEMLEISFKCQFGKGKVEVLSEENAEIINDYTMDDFQNILGKITMNLMNTATSKPNSLIGMLMLSHGSEDDYVSTDGNTDDNNDDFSSEDNYTSDFEDITFEEDENTDNYLNPSEPLSFENIKDEVDINITDGLTRSLDEYKAELLLNENANLGDFLTVENVQKYCGDKYVLELIDSTTIKCTVLGDTEYIYYALMNIDGYDLVVTEVEVLTEEEYLNR